MRQSQPDRAALLRIDARRRAKTGLSLHSGRKVSKINNENELDKLEAEFLKGQAVLLKAGGYSYSYISDTIMVRTGIVKLWFAEPKIKKQVLDIQKDMQVGAVSLMKNYTLECVEMLMEIARRTNDDKTAINALTEVLDRSGVTKVNKSESVTTKTDRREHEFSPEFFEKLEGLPIETQTKLAEMASEMQSLVEEARGTG